MRAGHTNVHEMGGWVQECGGCRTPKNMVVPRAAHTHALFRDDNSGVYYHLEEATRGTSYAASIKPFQRGKDGRGMESLN